MLQDGGPDVPQSEVAELPLPKRTSDVLNTAESCADATVMIAALARTARSVNISRLSDGVRTWKELRPLQIP